MFVEMDAWRCFCFAIHLIPLLKISTTYATSIMVSPYLSVSNGSSAPSTDWELAGYAYANTSMCNNESSYLELLNDADGLYGRSTEILSYHNNDFLLETSDTRYSVYFSFYFVTKLAENICAERNESVPQYYFSLVAMNGNVRDQNKGQVVWTANTMHPVTKNACFLLNDTDLMLVDYIGSSPEIVWHINSTSSVFLTISFEGNVVIYSNYNGSDPDPDPSRVPLTLQESFLYPTDTLMVLQVLEKQSTLTVNSSATNDSGNYTLALVNGRLVLYARLGPQLDDEGSPYGSPYWSFPDSSSSVVANENISFAAFCWDAIHQLRLIIGSTRPSNDSNGYKGMVSPEFCYTVPNNSDRALQITGLDHSTNATYATFLRLESDGDLRAYTVDNTASGSNATWRAFYSVFNSTRTPCALPLYCGFYGLCVSDRGDHSDSYCRCDYSNDPKLVFTDASDSKSGCNPESGDRAQLWGTKNMSTISRQGSTCAVTDIIAECASKGSRCKVDFFSVNNVHYFSLDGHEGVQDSDGCKQECRKVCACAAAFWSEGHSRCFLVLGSLGTIQQRPGGMQAFIKYVRITQAPSSSFTMAVIVPVLAATLVAGTLLVLSIFLVYWRRRRAYQRNELENERLILISMLDGANTERFTWNQMHEYTCGFSDLLGGGGFGRVYRGSLPDGTAIAVKKLVDDGPQSQGEKEFIAEVSILSRIHHVHLVHLIGFCLEGTHRILVYEYMENGSLDAWLFKSHIPPSMLQEAQSKLQHGDMNEKKDKAKEHLSWKTRFQIALGTAKGLAYLHEECDERIIHMDLKPQNILLSHNFQSKISDFGTSRRTEREQTSVMTVMRGTPGYLAPEWLLDCAITEKCDVYSFGIVLLEMVSGRKVKDLTAVKQKLSMRPLRESVMLDFLDESLRYNMYGSDVNEKEAVRIVEAALLCTRRDPLKRPAISNVVSMLEGREEVLQDVDAFEGYGDGDGVQDQQLLMYPSAMNRTMRMQVPVQLEGKLDSFTSLTDSNGLLGSNSSSDNNSNYSGKMIHTYSYKKYFNIDHNKSTTKASSSSSAEWDHLLSNEM